MSGFKQVFLGGDFSKQVFLCNFSKWVFLSVISLTGLALCRIWLLRVADCLAFSEFFLQEREKRSLLCKKWVFLGLTSSRVFLCGFR